MSSVAMERTSARAVLRWMPSPMAILAFAVGGVLVGITVLKGIQDPDYFWHVTTGQLIVTTGHVPSTDPFSFTWAGKPWTPHEWLSEVLIYLMIRGVGSIAALFIFGLIPASIVAVQAAMLSRRGVRAIAFLGPAALAGLAITPYVTLRPQAESWLMLSILLWGLWELRAEHPRRILWLVPFFALWANLHGVYVIGLGVVFTYLLFTLLGRTPMASVKRWVVIGMVGALAASAFTPAGPVGLLYPLRYIQPGNWGLANIAEWQSPSFHEPAHWAFLAMIVLVGLNGGRRTPGWLVMLSWVGIAMGLAAERNVPIAAVFCLPTLALGLEARMGERRERPYAPSRALGRRIIEVAAAVMIVVGTFVFVVPRGLGVGIQADIAHRFPVQGVNLLLKYKPDARVFAEYGWGGYVINKLYASGGRVFVDGRNDMYSEQILNDYSAIRAADPGWQQLAAKYGVNAILIKTEDTLARGPATDAGWCQVYRDETQVLYLPTCPASG
jgi:hypothetical protein